MRLCSPRAVHVTTIFCRFRIACPLGTFDWLALKRRYRYIVSLVVRLVIVGGAMSLIADQVHTHALHRVALVSISGGFG